MFESTNWVLDEGNNDQSGTSPLINSADQVVIATLYPREIASRISKPASPRVTRAFSEEVDQGLYQSSLIRRFDFSSALQRMSVICKNNFDNQYRCFVKGSPEKI